MAANPDDPQAIVLDSSQPESEDSPTTLSAKKRKPSRKPQKYRKAWEHYPEFHLWLAPVENNVYKAKCTFCCKVLVADISVLQAHAQAIRHVRHCQATMKANLAGQSSEPVQRRFFEREPTSGEKTNEGVSEDISLDTLCISDRLEGTSEAVYPEQPITIDMTQVPHLSAPRKTAEVPSYVSKAIVTKPAPQWKATAIVNGHVTRLELNDYKGRYLILFFYPQDFSALCPSELLALSDRVLEFRSLQTELVACSVDSHLSHLAWARTPRSEGGLGNPKIPLLADPTHSIARDYGVLLPDLGHTLRAHFIIDRRGVLRHMQVNDLGVGRGIDELLRITQALQHVDETETGCPVDWKPGLPCI